MMYSPVSRTLQGFKPRRRLARKRTANRWDRWSLFTATPTGNRNPTTDNPQNHQGSFTAGCTSRSPKPCFDMILVAHRIGSEGGSLLKS